MATRLNTVGDPVKSNTTMKGIYKLFFHTTTRHRTSCRYLLAEIESITQTNTNLRANIKFFSVYLPVCFQAASVCLLHLQIQ